MSNIRRQSIISSAIIYFGFALGFINTYLFTREGGFTESQYGLVGLFISIANIMYSFAGLGMHAFIYKFYPYYSDNLTSKKNDIMSVATTIVIIGFLLVLTGGIIFKDLVIRKFSENSKDLILYYEWLFPFGFGLTIYSILEAYAWQQRESVITNTLKEVVFRLITTILILLTFTGVIYSFDGFIKWFALTFLMIAFFLLGFLLYKKKINFSLSVSKVTKKFRKKILALSGFIWGGNIVYTAAQVFDSIIIASVIGLPGVAIFTLAQNISSLIQAPQRGIIAAAIAPLSKAWKDKDYQKINRIYQRSSINQLIFALGMFLLIWLNFTDGVFTFNLKTHYLDARYVFFFIGLWRVIDLGTGLNSQIIGTSVYWRFEFFTGIILIMVILPLNYFLTYSMGLIGPAISNLIGFFIYNFIRFLFLYKKFGMQPFSINTIYTILLGIGAFTIPYLLFQDRIGLIWIILRSVTFCTVYIAGVFYLRLSPDILPVLGILKNKVRGRR